MPLFLDWNKYVMRLDTPLRGFFVTFKHDDSSINSITFIFADGTTKRLGFSYGKHDGRAERYLMAKDEHLIGATIEYDYRG
jgi:hypothetical protein